MRFKNTPGKGWAPVKLTRAQLQNDLDAARTHLRQYAVSELKLADQINSLRLEVIDANGTIKQLAGDRDDWRDAFKLIMKLVK